MSHDLVLIAILASIFYILYASMGRANNVKHYVTVGSGLKIILGYFFFKGNKFSTKSVVGQVGNWISIILITIFIINGNDNAKELFLQFESFNLLIVFIVSIFVNK